MAGARCQAAVRVALEIGYRHIDTATMYRNERDVGRAVRASGVPRQQVFLTKLPPAGSGTPWTTASGRWAWTTWICGWSTGRRGLGPLVSTWKEPLAVRDAGLARAVGTRQFHITRPSNRDRIRWTNYRGPVSFTCPPWEGIISACASRADGNDTWGGTDVRT